MNFIYCFSPSQHNTSNNNFINVRWFLFLKRSYANIDFILFFWFPEVQPPARRRRRRRQQLHQHRLHRPGEIDDDWQLKYHVDFCFFSAPTPAPDHGHDNFSTLSFIGGMVNLIQLFFTSRDNNDMLSSHQVLAFGLVAIGFVAFKFYKARNERNYHTL